VTSDTRIELTVPTSTSVVPGWQSGDTAVRLPDLSFPGEPRDATSSGWRMTTNWVNGYEVRMRSTTSPALRGRNAIDGEGNRSSFADFRTTGCPCPWDVSSFDRGVFGYAVSVRTRSGAAATGVAAWGTSSQRRWRGFSRSGHRAYATPGGAGLYDMSLHLRAMIPDGAVQEAGSYRAGIVISVHPLV
jgi:hypothetical protein